MIERAVLVVGAGQLPLASGAQRVYLGSESCQSLIPPAREVLRALAAARREGMGFTLVTPFVTDRGLDRLERILRSLAREEPGCEVVANDWGVLGLVHELGLEPVLGRLLNKLRRGPRIMRVIDRLPALTLRQYQENNLTVPVYRRFLRERGVRRVEVDNLLQGLALDLGAEPWPLSGSIYTPYLAVSATRLCPLANCDSEGPVRIGVWPCKRQCRSYSLELRHPIMGGPLLVRGNEVLFEGPALPPEERLAEMGITRVVELARGDERGGGP